MADPVEGLAAGNDVWLIDLQRSQSATATFALDIGVQRGEQLLCRREVRSASTSRRHNLAPHPFDHRLDRLRQGLEFGRDVDDYVLLGRASSAWDGALPIAQCESHTHPCFVKLGRGRGAKRVMRVAMET